jgi:pyruvate formate lyase activating enzyme
MKELLFTGGGMVDLTGMVFDIRKYSVHDGPGIRTTVFLKGCPLTCWWCHNPESQSAEPEPVLRPNLCIACGECQPVCQAGAIGQIGDRLTWDADRCVRCGDCTQACLSGAREMAGRPMSVGAVLAEVERDRLFYEESRGGVTFSGGEPLLQSRFLSEVLRACHERELHTVVDTSGFASWEVFERILPYTDLFLYDLKHTDPELHLRYTGVPYEPIQRNLERLAERGRPVWLRVPVIPGLNDDLANLERVSELAARLANVEQINLLPYHPAAAGKYERMGRSYRLPETQSPSDERMLALAETMRRSGLRVLVGG